MNQGNPFVKSPAPLRTLRDLLQGGVLRERGNEGGKSSLSDGVRRGPILKTKGQTSKPIVTGASTQIVALRPKGRKGGLAYWLAAFGWMGVEPE